MKSYIFSILMNIVAAIVLFGKGATEINNLETSIPATLCVIAAIFSAIQVGKEKKSK
jgi:hypothetical protein